MKMSSHYKVLAHCTEAQVYRLAQRVTQHYPANQLKILSGPQVGMVQLSDEEKLLNTPLYAGDGLVTEVRLELDGQFGYGLVAGDNPRQAMSLALVDAALRKGGPLSAQLKSEIAELAYQLELQRQELDQLVAASKTVFEAM